VPGDGSRSRRAERMAKGIPIAEDVWVAIRELAGDEISTTQEHSGGR